MMEPLFVSIGVVALAEIGDKTQLLALLMATRFRQPVPVIAGVALATLLNHGIAALAGSLLTSAFSGPWVHWAVGLSFIAMAAWALIPDTLAEGPAKFAERYGPFAATFVSFFLIEIGDKTQIATAALAAHYQAIVPVVAGTTLGMLVADVPVVLLGGVVAQRLPLKPIRFVAAAAFMALGIVVLTA
jgi:putative Ca2+/H+ antiporter (TMEM165/GDT1 family)